MNKNTRKSTAIVSLVLVPLNLLGLGFTGCDSRDDDGTPTFSSADDGTESLADFADPDEPYTLDPVTNYTGTGPLAPAPTTQPLAQSAFASQPANPGTYYGSHYHHGGVMFIPIPFRAGYAPPFRPLYRPPVGRSYPSYARSTPSHSGVSRSSSSSVSRGGFGSSGRSYSSSSSS